jgi:hypothetical protein
MTSILKWALITASAYLLIAIVAFKVSEELASLLMWPSYIVAPRGSGFGGAILISTFLAAIIGAIASRAGSTEERLTILGILLVVACVAGRLSFKHAVRTFDKALEIETTAKRRLLSDPNLDFAELLAKGGYRVSGVADHVGPNDLMDFSYLLDAASTEPNVKRAVPVLMAGIRRDEAKNRGFTANRAVAAQTVFRITGRKVRYLGVADDLERCQRSFIPDPYEGHRGAKLCTDASELVDPE